MTRREREQDELVIAEIIAASRVLPRAISRGEFFRDATPVQAAIDGSEGACCAVGAGVLFRGCPREDVSYLNATVVFAKLYDVPHLYAIGVSDGFEGAIGRTDMDICGDPDDPLVKRRAYQRGWAVGQAIAVATVDEVRP